MQRETTAPPELEGHVPALDGVRGLAILVVMIGHFNIGYYPVYPFEQALKTLIITGWWGVDLFFVLSGFLITGILLDAKGANHYFRNFYLRRILRIFPLYYGFLFAFFILAPMLRPPAPGGQYATWMGSQAWFWTYLSNYQILFPGYARPYPLSHFWTLAVEEQFYLFWPAIVWLTTRKGLVRVCLFCVAACLAIRVGMYWSGVNPVAGYRITPARLDTLAIGALLAVLVREPNAWQRVRRYAPTALLVSVAGVVGLSIPTRSMAQSSIEMESVGYPLLAIVSCVLIVFAIDPSAPETRIGRFFQTGFMRLLGKYSYAIYVFHFPLAGVLDRFGLTVQSFPRIAGSELPGAIAYTVIACSISVGIALLSWHLYEKHFLKLKRFFPRRESSVPSSSSTGRAPAFGSPSSLAAPTIEPE